MKYRVEIITRLRLHDELFRWSLVVDYLNLTFIKGLFLDHINNTDQYNNTLPIEDVHENEFYIDFSEVIGINIQKLDT